VGHSNSEASKKKIAIEENCNAEELGKSGK
jgi:hypothetical protein